jgi:peptidoglycan-associated lipoprotein
MTWKLGIWSLFVVAIVTLLSSGCAQKSTTAGTTGTQLGASGPSAEEIRAREEEERRRRIAESQLAARSTMAPGAQILDTIYFEFDQATLSDLAKDTLVRNAEWLRANADARVQVEGNADERGTPEYNLALGERRAEAVKSYLSSLGVDGGRLVTISYGEERPADSGQGEDAWAKNRRVDFKAM